MKTINYKIETASCKSPEPIRIGIQGEAGVREILIDMTEFKNTYGSGSVIVNHRRAGDAATSIVSGTTLTNNILRWVPSATDTRDAGIGILSLSWVVGSAIAKSVDIKTICTKSATGSSSRGSSSTDVADETIETTDLYTALAEVYGNECVERYRSY